MLRNHTEIDNFQIQLLLYSRLSSHFGRHLGCLSTDRLILYHEITFSMLDNDALTLICRKIQSWNLNLKKRELTGFMLSAIMFLYHLDESYSLIPTK